MEQYNAEQFVPKFILEDKNGYAMAKAIEAAMRYMNKTIEAGIACVNDVESMPEWRLDEMAWETNCLYDYEASVEEKRAFIENAMALYRVQGTLEALYKYVSSYFPNMWIEEWYEYDGEPYHFRVGLYEKPSAETMEKAAKAISVAKNVRSVMDGIMFGSSATIGLSAASIWTDVEFKKSGMTEFGEEEFTEYPNDDAIEEEEDSGVIING